MTDQLSVRVDDPAQIAAMMARIRARPPATLLGRPVEVTDLAPAADVVLISWTDGRAVLRPSGTEPKLKAYLEVVVADVQRGDDSTSAAAGLLAQLRTDISLLLGTG